MLMMADELATYPLELFPGETVADSFKKLIFLVPEFQPGN